MEKDKDRTDNNSRETKIPLCFILVLGGHTFEALSILDRLREQVTPFYLVCTHSPLIEEKIRIPGPVYKIPLINFQASFEKKYLMKYLYLLFNLFTIFFSVFKSLMILRKIEIRAVVSCGSGSSLPPLLAAKILGKKVIYIESACRVKTRSMCGNLVYRFLADLFLVQWEEQIRVYPKAKFVGRPF